MDDLLKEILRIAEDAQEYILGDISDGLFHEGDPEDYYYNAMRTIIRLIEEGSE